MCAQLADTLTLLALLPPTLPLFELMVRYFPVIVACQLSVPLPEFWMVSVFEGVLLHVVRLIRKVSESGVTLNCADKGVAVGLGSGVGLGTSVGLGASVCCGVGVILVDGEAVLACCEPELLKKALANAKVPMPSNDSSRNISRTNRRVWSRRERAAGE